MHRGKILFVLFKTAIFTALVPYVIGFWLPGQVQRVYASSLQAQIVPLWREVLSLALFFLGAAIYSWCTWDFSVKGMGTPAPIDAPKNLVVNGLYRFVRNPMYLGVFCFPASRAIFSWSLPILLYLIFFAGCACFFVLFYEEPHLCKVFGEPYADYCRRVPRWFPRFSSAPAKQ
jgi:protein-S-isoprenylcysteine O-methyltransferase Ste14